MKKMSLLMGILWLAGCSDNESNVQAAVVSKNTAEIPTSMDVTEVAKCAAAAMKAGQGIGLYKPWANELIQRYSKIYPEKTFAEIDVYTTERILDKRRYLNSIGLSTPVAFHKFYKQNCEI